MSKSEFDWLKNKANYIKIDRIEKELEMSQETLRKFVDGKLGLAEHWHEAVNSRVTGNIIEKLCALEAAVKVHTLEIIDLKKQTA